MKINRYGQATILTPKELDYLCDSLPGAHRTCAYILRFTACRVSEGLSLQWKFISNSSILFPAPITKGSKYSRQVPINVRLKEVLQDWKSSFDLPVKGHQYVIPGKYQGEHMTRQNFDYQLRKTCKELGFEGCSTHSFRRSCITELSRNSIPLATIKSITGHKQLSALQLYVEVQESEQLMALNAL